MTGSTQHSYAFMGFDSRLRLRHRSGSRHLKNSGTNPSGSELSVVEPILTCWGQAKCVILCDFPIKLKHSSKGEHNPLWKSPLSYHDCMILHMQLYIYIYTYWAEPSTFLYIPIYIYIHAYICGGFPKRCLLLLFFRYVFLGTSLLRRPQWRLPGDYGYSVCAARSLTA